MFNQSSLFFSRHLESSLSYQRLLHISHLPFQELKAGIVSGQLLVDFLCQSRPQAAGADVLALQSERTMFAETLGDLRLRWLHLQGELESQVTISASDIQFNTNYLWNLKCITTSQL